MSKPLTPARRFPIVLGPADRLYGYPFGVDGVANSAEAAKLLAVSERRLRDLCVPDRTGRSIVRRGYRTAGVWQSGAIYCRRSILEHLRTLEI